MYMKCATRMLPSPNKLHVLVVMVLLLGCALFRLRSPVADLSELKTQIPIFWDLEHGKTWSCAWSWRLATLWPVQQPASSTILAKISTLRSTSSHAPNSKRKVLRVQLSELYKMRPGPKKGRTPMSYKFLLNRIKAGWPKIPSRRRNLRCLILFSAGSKKTCYMAIWRCYTWAKDVCRI